MSRPAGELAPKPCARCGAMLRGRARAGAVYSHWTGAYYCGARDERACNRRARQRAGAVRPGPAPADPRPDR